MTENKEIRIGFVGVGGMGQCAHLKNYVNVAGCKVVALAELREKTGKLVAERYGIPKVYTSHDDMVKHEKPDALVASQPFGRHGVLLKELVKSGLPIFIEKPLAHSVQVAEEILKAAAAARSRIMVGYHKRSDPATAYARAEIDRLKASGELGKLRYVRILMPAGDWVAEGFVGMLNGGDPGVKLDWDPPAPDMDPETNKQYGAFVNYYIHQVNLMRYLLGEPYKVAFADPSGVLLAGQGQSGVACLIEMSPYVTTIDWQEEALIAFERGYIKVRLPAPLASNRPGTVEMYRDPGKGVTPQAVIPQLPWIHAMRQQAMNFVKFVRGEAPPPCEATEAIEDLKIARDYIRLLTGK